MLGSPAWVTDEADGPDLPGAWFNAHKTTGVVTSGTVSTGHLTTGLDMNYGLTGDYWWLETQPGHTYRVEVKFGDNPTIDTGGSAVISFIDPNDDDYPDASTCCESDHNRDDGATFIHFYRPTDEWNRRYLVNVTVYDNYNTGSANYNGPYTVTLTDITGVQRMVHTFSGGETRDSNQLLDMVDVTEIADIATRFTTGGHAAGYTLDRIKFLFNEIRNDGVTPEISLHSHTTMRSRRRGVRHSSARTRRRVHRHLEHRAAATHLPGPRLRRRILWPRTPIIGSCSWTSTITMRNSGSPVLMQP